MQVTVIGAGIIGVTCALALQQRGAKVLLVDRDGPAAGTSRGNAGIFATYAVSPEATPDLIWQLPRMLLDPNGALSLRWRHLPRAMPWLLAFLAAARPAAAARSGDGLVALLARVPGDTEPLLKAAGAMDLLRRSGGLYVFRSQKARDALRPEWAEMARRGIPHEELESADLRALEPAISKAYTCGFLLPELTHTVDPEQIVHRLFALFVQRGGRFERAELREIRSADRPQAVSADGRTFSADRLVIACGIHSGALCRGLGLRVPLEAERGYNTTLPDPGVTLTRPVCVAEAGYYMTPMQMGLRIGGKVELGGLDLPPRWSRATAMLDHAGGVLPGLRTTGGARWMGLRPSTPDSLPVIGPVPGMPHIQLAFGHSHLGLTLAGPTGGMIADLVYDVPTAVPHAPYAPDRFL